MIAPPPGSPLFPYTTLFRSFETGVTVERVTFKTNAVVTAGQVWQPPILGAALVIKTGGNFADGESALDVLEDRKSTRLNSSHTVISYAVFCLKKKTPAVQRR